MLVYSSEKMEKVAYNTLSIPLGAEYCVMLPDNTKVFLNSGSELRYPVAFNNNSREVFLQGEAYFEAVSYTHLSLGNPGPSSPQSAPFLITGS